MDHHAILPGWAIRSSIVRKNGPASTTALTSRRPPRLGKRGFSGTMPLTPACPHKNVRTARGSACRYSDNIIIPRRTPPDANLFRTADGNTKKLVSPAPAKHKCDHRHIEPFFRLCPGVFPGVLCVSPPFRVSCSVVVKIALTPGLPFIVPLGWCAHITALQMDPGNLPADLLIERNSHDAQEQLNDRNGSVCSLSGIPAFRRGRSQ
jgi:hypothetical protein